MRSVAFLALASVPLCSVPVTADDLATAMVGVWNITEFSRKDVASGTAEKPYRAHPKGRIIFTKGGNNIWFLVSENQPRPASVAPTDPERAELFKNMFAFAGTYKVEGGSSYSGNTQLAWVPGWLAGGPAKVEVSGKQDYDHVEPVQEPGDGPRGCNGDERGEDRVGERWRSRPRGAVAAKAAARDFSASVGWHG